MKNGRNSASCEGKIDVILYIDFSGFKALFVPLNGISLKRI